LYERIIFLDLNRKILGAFYLMTQMTKMSFCLSCCQMNNKDRTILVSTCVTKWKALMNNPVIFWKLLTDESLKNIYI